MTEMKVHKQHRWADWASSGWVTSHIGSKCGIWGAYATLSGRWSRVTCLRCLKMKRKPK